MRTPARPRTAPRSARSARTRASGSAARTLSPTTVPRPFEAVAARSPSKAHEVDRPVGDLAIEPGAELGVEGRDHLRLLTPIQLRSASTDTEPDAREGDRARWARVSPG